MSRLQRRIVSETRAALEPLGYYEPTITYDVAHDADRWRVIILVTPGRPVRLSEVSVTAIGPGANERTIRDIIDAQDLKPGLRLNHGTYERVKGALLRAAKNEGYLDAHLVKNDLVIDRQERRATVVVAMDTGKRYSYGEIKIAQDVIHDDPMRRLLRMKEGDPYTLDSLLRTQYVLDDSQYFSAVSIETGAIDREALTVPITVSAEPNRKHRFGTSLGYGTDTEARGKFTWDNRRVNAAGHRFKAELLGSSIIKQLSTRYVVPVMDVALEKLEFTGTVVEEDIGDTVSQRAEVGSGLTQVLGRWQRVIFVRLSNETTTEGTGALRQRRTDFYMFPGISYSTLPSYIVGGKARPYRLYAELRGSPSSLGSDASFLQLRLQGERMFDLSDRWHLYTRAELGTSRVDEARGLPASQRFFAGGDRSVRGFALNELAPRDEQGNSVGGRHMATGTVEVMRNLPRNFGVAAFYDIGNAFDNFSDPGLEYAAGLGVRYNIAVATFGVDVAQPLSESRRSPRLHLYISTQF
jgi:translocation and assembly module TamA